MPNTSPHLANVWWADEIALPSQLPGRLWRITPTGVLHEFPLPTPDCWPVSIASGVDGTLWLAEFGANRIAHVTVQGDVTEFDVEDCRPLAIAAGPDGAAWFVDVDHSRLGRIGPDGKLSFVPRPGGHVPHRGLVCGPDKNLWMVGEAGLVRVNLAARRLRNGSVIELPTEKWPGRLAVGANNDLWFTERHDSAIGRVMSDGTIKRFAIPQPARAIVNGPLGSVWFTTDTAVGRMTANGDVTSFATTNEVRPELLTVGPDGHLWFSWTDPTRFDWMTGPTRFGVGRMSTAGTMQLFDSPGSILFRSWPLRMGTSGTRNSAPFAGSRRAETSRRWWKTTTHWQVQGLVRSPPGQATISGSTTDRSGVSAASTLTVPSRPSLGRRCG